MISTSTVTQTFIIASMDCADEFTLIERGLRQVDGVRASRPDYIQRALRVEFDPRTTTSDAINAKLAAIGFPGQPLAEGETPAVHSPRLSSPVLAGIAALLLAGVAWLVEAFWFVSSPAVASSCFAVIAAAVAGLPVARAAWRTVRLLRLDMNVLMTVAAIGAVAAGEFFEGAAAMVLFGISLWLEDFSLGKARREIQSLAQLTPSVAHRIKQAACCESNACCDDVTEIAAIQIGGATTALQTGPEIDVHPNALQPGDVIRVKPGERIPVDGVVERGGSSVDDAAITGESIPVEKAAGDAVFAGALNGEGVLDVLVEKSASESTLAHIAKLVEEAQATRSPRERFIDQFARWYTPCVLTAALLMVIVPPIVVSLTWTQWLGWAHSGLVMLVIACPCALVISTPVTVVCALHRAAKFGILVKGGEFLEAVGSVSAVVFDKTGTLTKGEPQVTHVTVGEECNEMTLLTIAASLESHSEHPLARAVVSYAVDRGVQIQPVTNFSALRGFGVAGDVDNEPCVVAQARYFQDSPLRNAIQELQANNNNGGAMAFVVRGAQLLGAIELHDEPREDARAAVARLKSTGVENIVMLTGDNGVVAGRIAHELGIVQVHAELLPEHKTKHVERLRQKHGAVAMIGDGVNDAPALASATVGIAFGGEASATAMETADVVIMSPHVNRIPTLIEVSRKMKRILTANIVFAIAMKLAVMVLAAAGVATLWMAVAADVGASLIVIFNGMRLLKQTPTMEQP